MAEQSQDDKLNTGAISVEVDRFLELTTNPMRATLLVKSALGNTGITLTKDHIISKLQSAKVVAGQDWAAIEKMITEKIYDKPVVVAAGIIMKPAIDAVIEEKLKIDADVKPVLGEDGKADYKNVDNIHQVKKGDVLSVKIPGQAGIQGQDIFGNIQPTTLPKDLVFKLGANTEITPDGLQVIASVSGYVFHQGGAINVGVTYVLQGDVDFNTGNLHYLGDIQILGSVTTGFTVEAQGSITIEGNVDGADVISHGGDITINSSVFGHGKGKIIAKKDIHLIGGQDIHIECESGTLFVEKSLLTCTVLAKSVRADKPGCSVVGGSIRAYDSVLIAHIGGEGCQTHISIVDKDAEAAKAKLIALDKLKHDLQPKIAPIETRLKGMKVMAAKMGGSMSERAKAELKTVLDQYMIIKGKEKEIDAIRDKLNEILKATPKHIGRFGITEKIVWGGLLEMYGHHRELVEEDVQKEWICGIEGLMSRTLMDEPPPAAKSQSNG